MKSEVFMEHEITPQDLRKFFGIRQNKITKVEVSGDHIYITESMDSKEQKAQKSTKKFVASQNHEHYRK